jgi:hypothetical protein
VSLGRECTFNDLQKKRGPRSQYVESLEARVRQLEAQTKISAEALPSPSIAPDVRAFPLPTPPSPLPSALFGDSVSHLCSKDDASYFIQFYCSKVYPAFPIVHLPTVTKMFEHETYLGDRKKTLLILSLILSATTLARDDFDPVDMSTIEDKCEEVCMHLKLRPYEQSSCTIEDVQAALLLGLAYFNKSQRRLSRFLLDDALRMSHHLCLLKDPAGSSTSLIDREIRKRVAWMVFTSDLFTSFVSNTPDSFDGDPFSLPLPLEVDDQYISEEGLHPDSVGKPSVLSCMVLNIKVYQLMYLLIRYPTSSETLVHILATIQEWKSTLSTTLKNIRDEAFGIGRSNILLTCFMIETTVRRALAKRLLPLPTNTQCVQEISAILKKIPVRHIRCHGSGAVRTLKYGAHCVDDTAPAHHGSSELIQYPVAR